MIEGEAGIARPVQVSALKRLFTAMIAGQVLWWFVLQRLGRCDDAVFLGLTTLTLGLALALTPLSFLSAVEARLKERPGLFLSLVGLLVLAHPVAFFAGPRAFNDAPNLFRGALYLHQFGFQQFFAEYFQLPWLGQLHPPLVPIAVSPWIGYWQAQLPESLLPFALFGLLALLATYRLSGVDIWPGLCAVLSLLGMRYFWLYLTTPGLVGLGTAGAVVAHLGGHRMAHDRRGGWQLMAVGTTVAVYSNYLALLLMPSLLAWVRAGARLKLVFLSLSVSMLAFAPWVVFVSVDGTQVKPLLRHLPVRPDVLTEVGATHYEQTGELGVDAYPLHPVERKRRLARTLGTFTSQGIAVLLLFLGLAWAFGRSLWDTPTALWVGAGVLAILLQPLSRYAIQALPALALVMARGLSRLPPGWALRLAIFCISTALMATYQHPGATYPHLFPVPGF